MFCSTSAPVRDPEAWVSVTLVGRFLRSCPERWWGLTVRELLGIRAWLACFKWKTKPDKKTVSYTLLSPGEGDSEESR
jgi:hypothetical protein